MADPKEAATKVKRPSAKKRDIQNEKRRQNNKAFKSRVSTAINALKSAVVAKDAPVLPHRLSAVYSLMDKGVKTGLYKQNKAARVKSRLHALTQKH